MADLDREPILCPTCAGVWTVTDDGSPCPLCLGAPTTTRAAVRAFRVRKLDERITKITKLAEISEAEGRRFRAMVYKLKAERDALAEVKP